MSIKCQGFCLGGCCHRVGLNLVLARAQAGQLRVEHVTSAFVRIPSHEAPPTCTQAVQGMHLEGEGMRCVLGCCFHMCTTLNAMMMYPAVAQSEKAVLTLEANNSAATAC